MKRLGTLGIVGLLLLLGMYGCNSYNGLVAKDNNVEQLWANVQTQYQRRADLINNLVKTVQGAADFERGTLTDVIEARAKATSIQLSADELTPENMEKFQAAQDQLSGTLSRLLVAVERYPDLKANQNFLELQAQIEGTENRIAVARNDFNAGIADYNLAVRSFPMNLMAGMFGFERKAPFAASEAAQEAPDVDFDFE
ncbi:LemA family protein [Jiulongibacter sediminis]|uniref:LemA family protein n=1 Tax=Jiulongibacter sediminis TaxID=1605367 RepID=A0A0P7BS09_9BACT|nr:LemA family protein [Jiulongibacter sediminis]KPM47185.1 LemA family protein [Jiulongibacter sediminis]TBX22743.1 LemA family protein [Jiulongibacter sediminis]